MVTLASPTKLQCIFVTVKIMLNLRHCENLKPYPNTEDSRQYTVLCTGEVINHYTQYNTEINDPQWHQQNAVLLY